MWVEFNLLIIISIVEPKWCGGKLQAKDTPIPVVPFNNKFGIRLGKITGSCSSSEKFGFVFTTFLLISLNISKAILLNLASV